jgi:hypothetical protein
MFDEKKLEKELAEMKRRGRLRPLPLELWEEIKSGKS